MVYVEDKEYFSQNVDYEPVVGDSVTGDTPLFIKYNKTGLIDIVPISELIDENSVRTDHLGREYDFSPKKFKVLCRSGWVAPNYLYRHKTEKPIYKVTNTDKSVIFECTEDHSLYDNDKNKIKPSEITNNTKLEYYTKKVYGDDHLDIDQEQAKQYAQHLYYGKIERVPIEILNTNPECKSIFISEFLWLCYIGIGKNKRRPLTKTAIAGILYLNNTKQ